MSKFVLASQSPRRRELIRLLGYAFETMGSDVDESQVTDSNPAANVAKTARLKAAAVAARLRDAAGYEDAVIVAADTTVALDGQMLGKPKDTADARWMLSALRGRSHEVHTGIVLLALAAGREMSGVHTAVVAMRDYSDDEITAYIASGDPMDKAGAYAIQHPGFRPVAHLQGCFTGVVGLSVCHLLQMLSPMGLSNRADLSAVLRAHQQVPCPLYETIAGRRP